MPIKFNEEARIFTITTTNTQYVFKIVGEQYLIHCYYGARSDSLDYSYNVQALNFSPIIENVGIERFSLSDAPLEFSYFGSGDFRTTSLKIKGENGDSCTFFAYRSYEIFEGRKALPGLPCARAAADTQTLAVHLYDSCTCCELILYYTVYPSYDLITRSFEIRNVGKYPVKIQKAMSILLDLPEHEYDILTLHGCQTTERNLQRIPAAHGNYSIGSRRGASGHSFNPFIALTAKDAGEESGDVYAFNFVYSGSFSDEVEVDSQGNTRVSIGLGEENFAYTVNPGEQFFSPEGIMLYTADGLGDMSRKMHAFIRDTILPREHFPQKPIVLNTWEAFYYNIDSKTILDLSTEGMKCGIDMVVVDDGWFGKRNDEKTGLGDWYPNLGKFPDGLKSFVARVKAKGVKFGMWIEPEMVNPDSDLYRAHPDWCLTCKGRVPTLSRNQLVLDFCNPAVLCYLKNIFTDTLQGIGLDYIKWDFNRNLSDVGSAYLPAGMQDEAFFRYQSGVYNLYFWFMENFPDVMIENCAGGGGRYDLGMMAVSGQIWASDNTRAADRVRIQYGSTIAYPACVMSCHVSDPGTGANQLKNLDYKYKVALGGSLGYEFNLLAACEAVKEEIKSQTAFYRRVEDVIKNGQLFRLISPFENPWEVSAYYYSDRLTAANRILLSYLQNFPYQKREISELMDLIPQKVHTLKIKAADPQAEYIEVLSGKRYSGTDLQAGIRIRMSATGEFGQLMLFEKS